jgi:hypothetical protein
VDGEKRTEKVSAIDYWTEADEAELNVLIQAFVDAAWLRAREDLGVAA